MLKSPNLLHTCTQHGSHRGILFLHNKPLGDFENNIVPRQEVNELQIWKLISASTASSSRCGRRLILDSMEKKVILMAAYLLCPPLKGTWKLTLNGWYHKSRFFSVKPASYISKVTLSSAAPLDKGKWEGRFVLQPKRNESGGHGGGRWARDAITKWYAQSSVSPKHGGGGRPELGTRLWTYIL